MAQSSIVEEFGLSPGAAALAGQCPNCNSPADTASGVADYLFNVEWDRLVLPCRKVLQCGDCEILYAWPMPDESKLQNYYTNIYRAPGRPHHFSGHPEILYRHLAYLSYITTFVPLPEVGRVYEIGSGFGEMGSLLKALNPRIELLTHEPDSHVREHLEKAGYIVLPPEAPVEGTVDLVLSIHSMEHFTSLQQFFSLSASLRSGGYFFVEVPNCTIADGWVARPYDSPHLIFFDAKTLTSSFESRQFRTVAISKAGISLSEDFKLCAEWKTRFGGWQPQENLWKRQRQASPRDLARQFLPNRAKSVIRAAVESAPGSQLVEGAYDLDNSATHGWLLRGLFQKV